MLLRNQQIELLSPDKTKSLDLRRPSKTGLTLPLAESCSNLKFDSTTAGLTGLSINSARETGTCLSTTILLILVRTVYINRLVRVMARMIRSPTFGGNTESEQCPIS